MFALFKNPDHGLKLVPIYLLLLLTTTCQLPQIEAQSVSLHSDEEIYQRMLDIKKERYSSVQLQDENYVGMAHRECVLFGRGCSPERRNLIRSQVELEWRYVNENNFPCPSTPEIHAQFRNPPPLDDAGGNTPKAYTDWQTALLATGQSFCNPLRNLHCSPVSGNCVCYPGTHWNQSNFECSLGSGQSCDYHPGVYVESGGKAPAYFNPVSPLTTFRTETVSRLCRSYSCSRPPFFKDTFCLSPAHRDEARRKAELFEPFLTRRHDEDCVPADQEFLLTVPALPALAEEHAQIFLARLAQLTDLHDGTHFFCSPAQFLTCSAATQKCDCMTPAIFNATTNTCTLPPPSLQCGNFKTIESVRNDSWVPEAREAFESVFEAQAPPCALNINPPRPERQCLVDDDVIDGVESDCTCPGRRAGITCEDPLSLYLTKVRPTTFPKDQINVARMWRVFDGMNGNARYMESVRLGVEGTPCHPTIEVVAKHAERIIRTLNSMPRNVNLTTQFYEDIGGFVLRIRASVAATGGLLCNSIFGIRSCVWNGQTPVTPVTTTQLTTPPAGTCRGFREVTFIDLARHLVQIVDKVPCGAPCDPNVPSTPEQYDSPDRIANLESLFVTGVGDKFCGPDPNRAPSESASTVYSCGAGGSGGGSICICSAGGRQSDRKFLNVQLGSILILLAATHAALCEF